MTNEREKFASWLVLQLEERGWSNRELSRRAGVSSTAINDAVSGQGAITAKFCRKISRALQVPLEETMRRAGLLPGFFVDDEALTFRELLAIINELPDDARKELLEFAKFKFQNRLAKKNATDRLGALEPVYQTSQP